MTPRIFVVATESAESSPNGVAPREISKLVAAMGFGEAPSDGSLSMKISEVVMAMGVGAGPSNDVIPVAVSKLVISPNPAFRPFFRGGNWATALAPPPKRI